MRHAARHAPRPAAARLAGLLALALPVLGGLSAASAQEHITVHPGPQGETELSFPTQNNPNYLDYGPLPDNPGADKSQDYMDQAGGNDAPDTGPGSDVDADVLPDSDGAYDE